MQRLSFLLTFGGFLLATSANSAYAANHPIICDSTPGELNALMTGGSVNAGDTIQITGICIGDTVLLAGVSLVNHNNSSTLSTTDGVQGQVNLFGSANVTNIINGLTLEGFSTDMGEQANLVVGGSANLNLTNSEVKNAQRDGIDIMTNSSVLLQNTLIDGNGIANIADKNSGIKVRRGGVVNDTNGSAFSVIENNAGFGINAQGAYIELADTNFSGNTLPAINAFATTVNMGGGTVATSGTLPAIEALSASSVTLVGTTVSGPAGAVLVASASSLVLAQATISTTSTTVPAVEASATSSIVITGGDTITASSGIAMEADHSSSIVHQALSKLQPGQSNAVESITGSAVIQVQSSMDLGQGTIASAPSITWTLAGGQTINVQQNSSLRLSGGVAITGNVIIQQGSNAFLNTANGGTNAISGGTMSCPFGTVAASHVAAPTKVTPNVAETTSYASASSPLCLPF